MSSETRFSNWTGLNSAKKVRLYRSEQRSALLRLCGWEDGSSIRWFSSPRRPRIDSTALSAAVAVFQLDMRSALDILKEGSDQARDGFLKTDF